MSYLLPFFKGIISCLNENSWVVQCQSNMNPELLTSNPNPNPNPEVAIVFNC